MVAPFAHYDQTSIHGSKFTASTTTRSHRIDFVTDASSHNIPGIENLNAKPGEVPDVAGDDSKIMFNGGCGDHAVRCVERRSFELTLAVQHAPAVGNRVSDRQNASVK